MSKATITIRKVAGGANWGRGFAVKVGDSYLSEAAAVAKTSSGKVDKVLTKHCNSTYSMIRAAVYASRVASRFPEMKLTPFVAALARGAVDIVTATENAAQAVTTAKKEINGLEERFRQTNASLVALGQAPLDASIMEAESVKLSDKLRRAEEDLNKAKGAEKALNDKATGAMAYQYNIRQGNEKNLDGEKVI